VLPRLDFHSSFRWLRQLLFLLVVTACALRYHQYHNVKDSHQDDHDNLLRGHYTTPTAVLHHEEQPFVTFHLGRNERTRKETEQDEGRKMAKLVVDLSTGGASLIVPSKAPSSTTPVTNQRHIDSDNNKDDDDTWFHLLGGLSVVSTEKDDDKMVMVSSKVEKSLIHPLFGEYSKVTFTWNSSPLSSSSQPSDPTDTMVVETSYLIFSDYEMIIFDQYFENGWTKPSGKETDSRIVVPFPSIDLTSIPSLCEEYQKEGEEEEDNTDDRSSSSCPCSCLGYLLWGDCFLSDTRSGNWKDLSTEDWGQLFTGDTYGQPFILHDETGRTTVWSSFTNFFVSGAAVNDNVDDMLEQNTTLGFGLRTTLNSIPKDFHHSSIMFTGYGINSTLMQWGDILIKQGGTGKERAQVYDDFLLAHLGYWTDNGAFHYRGVHPDQGNMEEALLVVKEGLIKDQDIPIRYMQWDDWWMESKGDIPGMLSWNPKSDVFPTGFSDWLGLPLSMYAPEYSGENIWINDYNWKTVHVPRGSTAIPLDPNFYRHLFANGTKIGMVMFEQDFLCSYGIGDSGLTSTDVMSGSTWLEQMDAAAREFGITLQFCMPDAYHLLESTKIWSVTNARATGDNVRSYRSILPMGQNGLLFYSLGVYASRDNVWTSDAQVEQVGCGNKDFCFETNAHLDNAVAVLSGGPYGIADKLGFTNRTVVMYATRIDGLLLRPRLPLASLDFVYTASDAKGCNIWAAHDDFGIYRWSYVIGVELEKDITLTPSRLIQGSLDSAPQTMVAWEVILGQEVSGVTVFTESSPLVFPKSEPLNLPYDIPASSHTHFATAPTFPNGMVILGEVGKWATMSYGRVTSLNVDDHSVTLRVVGAPSETIAIAYLAHVTSPKDSSSGEISSSVQMVRCTFAPPESCQEYDNHGNQQCRLWIVCQPSDGCNCSNGLWGSTK